jgi:hypothetical protein
MIIQIQGHSDDIVEVHNDVRGAKQYDLGDDKVALITVGDPNDKDDRTTAVVMRWWFGPMGWTFAVGLSGLGPPTGSAVLPGRLDLEVDRAGRGPLVILDVPDDTPVRVAIFPINSVTGDW